MSKKNTNSKSKQTNKHIKKCYTCENYDKDKDVCKKGVPCLDCIDYSKCTDYLVKENLIMY